jgi:hypothetical protein
VPAAWPERVTAATGIITGVLASVDWGMVGAYAGIAAVALVPISGAIKWWSSRRRARAEQVPRIQFGDVYFARPGEHPRTEYRYALGVTLTNTGGGPALDLHWGYTDEDGEWAAEVVHRSALVPNERTEDWSGVRSMEDQSRDATEKQARAFYESCLVFAECWDTRGQHYVFFPFGGGPAEDRHGGPHALREHLSQFPSRGEQRRSLGSGRLDAALTENTRRRWPRRRR